MTIDPDTLTLWRREAERLEMPQRGPAGGMPDGYTAARRMLALIAEVDALQGHVLSKHNAMKMAADRADAADAQLIALLGGIRALFAEAFPGVEPQHPDPLTALAMEVGGLKARKSLAWISQSVEQLIQTDPILRRIGAENASQAERIAFLETKLREFGKVWHAQEGCGAAVLDELADLVPPLDEPPESE